MRVKETSILRQEKYSKSSETNVALYIDDCLVSERSPTPIVAC